MISDGLTKGVVDRVALHLLMEGKLSFQHAVKIWSRKVGSSSPVSPEGSPEEAGDLGDYLFCSHSGSIQGATPLPFDTMPTGNKITPTPSTPPKAPWRLSLPQASVAAAAAGEGGLPEPGVQKSLLVAKSAAVARLPPPLPRAVVELLAAEAACSSSPSAVPKPPTGRGHPESSAAASASTSEDDIGEQP